MDGLLQEIPASRFDEWMIYFGIEPFGHLLQDTHFATVESILENIRRGSKGRMTQVKDFQLIKPSTRQTAQQLWEGLKSWAYRAGARKKK